MLPSARPLTTSWPMKGSVSAFFDRADQLRRLSLVAIDTKRVGQIALRIGLVGDEHALPVLGGSQRIADRRFIAADLLDDRFQHVDVVVIRRCKIVGGEFVLVLTERPPSAALPS